MPARVVSENILCSQSMFASVHGERQVRSRSLAGRNSRRCRYRPVSCPKETLFATCVLRHGAPLSFRKNTVFAKYVCVSVCPCRVRKTYCVRKVCLRHGAPCCLRKKHTVFAKYVCVGACRLSSSQQERACCVRYVLVYPCRNRKEAACAIRAFRNARSCQRELVTLLVGSRRATILGLGHATFRARSWRNPRSAASPSTPSVTPKAQTRCDVARDHQQSRRQRSVSPERPSRHP